MRRLIPFLAFVLVILLAFWKVIFHSEYTLLHGGDMASSYFPWFDVASYWLKQGVFPLWDPYVYAGKSFMGEPQPGLFYPVNWLFLLLPTPKGGVSRDGIQALLILDYLMMGYFFYLLARSFNLSRLAAGISGIAFSLGGFLTQIYGYVNILSGFVWLPLTLLYFRRSLLADRTIVAWRNVLLSGLFLALTFLPGHHIPPVHTGLLLLFYAIFVLLRDWKNTLWVRKIHIFILLGSVALSAALVSAVQWTISFEWAQQVYRWVLGVSPVAWGEMIPYSAIAGAGSAYPEDVLSLLLPYVSTGPNLYVGPAILLLALVALLFVRKGEARFFGAAAFIYLFLSWADYSALHGWANTFIPGIWFARESFHFLVPFQACLALLAGWGLDCIMEAYRNTPDPGLDNFLRKSGWAMAIIVLAAAVLISAAHIYRGQPLDHPYLRGAAALAVYICVLGFLCFLLYRGQIRSNLFGFLIAIVVVVDLSSHLSQDIPKKVQPAGRENTYVSQYWEKPPAAEFLISKRQSELFRVDDLFGIFPPNYGDVWRLDAAMGHGATALVKYFKFRDTDWAPVSNPSSLLNIRYYLSRTAMPDREVVFQGETYIYRNPRAVPRAFAASHYRSFLDDEEMISWLRSPLMRLGETVLLRDKDLAKLPQGFRNDAFRARDGIEIYDIQTRTAALKRVPELRSTQERWDILVNSSPWGWSTGDEVTFHFRPERFLEECFVVFRFYPRESETSHLSLRLEGPRGVSEILAELPGLQEGEQVTDRVELYKVSIHNLEPAEHMISLEITDDCSADVESIEITTGPDQIPTPGTVEVLSLEPNRMRLQARLDRPAFVVISEVFYDGWRATLDGEPVPLFEGDYILRTLPVPAGNHTVELLFRPRILYWGIIITTLSLAGMVLFLFCTRSRHHFER